MDPVRLHDDAVLLEAPTAHDVADIVLACQDPEVSAWVTVPRPYRRADAEAFVEHVVGPGWASGRECVWAIRAAGARPPGTMSAREAPGTGGAGPGRLLGMIGLHGIVDGSAELGYWVAPWARGRGLAGRAVALVLDHAFGLRGLDLQRVSWHAYVGNWPSRRVAWRAGFRTEGTIRLEGVQRGVRRDTWVATLLRDDPRVPCEPWPAQAPDDGSAVPPDRA
ncbi:MAG TPA: GNAT family protein [Actinotalea sp.]|nr:GNAT family protein [Actinotalea sp.]